VHGERVRLGHFGHGEHPPQRNTEPSVLGERGRGRETVTPVLLARFAGDRALPADKAATAIQRLVTVLLAGLSHRHRPS
jgi:hypothetical protein